MMHRCNMGACSCGLYNTQSNSYPMLFSMSSFDDDDDDEGEMYQPGSVDCTLSLGTPSTRRFNENHDIMKRSSNCMSGFGWNVFPSKHSLSKSDAKSHGNGAGGDPLLARRCANCDTTSTPLWRNGPRGPKSLCNACGIRFKKEERRATSGHGAAAIDKAEHVKMNGGSWIPPCYSNEFRFIEDHDQEQENGIPFMSWRFNVTDRPSLVHH